MSGGAGILERNLAALGGRSAAAVRRISGAMPRIDAAFEIAPDAGLTGSIADAAGRRRLASARGPVEEARRLIATLDLAENAVVVVLGLGSGQHVAELAKKLGRTGAVLVFEPDAGLVRSLFSSVDCTPWLGASNIALFTDAQDAGAIAAGVSGLEGMLAAGTLLLEHPASRSRLGDLARVFGETFGRVMHAVRTNVLTTIVQVDVSVRNQLQNLRWYARCPGVADLAGACRGVPAVVVSAGPSLARNVELLSRPGVRERVVIIAVQTVLKTLLARGIRPHFVTALDHHEISRRFYEGLSGRDVEGVTLVAEPKANPAILAAFPGRIRCVRDEVLDAVLPRELLRDMGGVPPGATVAHLAYYLARHLACDPVMLIGQDLGFTDGQYYAPHAAIHNVWAGELNEFRSLEMFEWERIVRMRSTLRRATDHLGRPVYTDEQMHTYLVQFERDFAQDAARGLTTIDATEGGVRKQHTSAMALAEALERHAGDSRVSLPPTPDDLPAERLRQVGRHLVRLREDCVRVGELSRETADLLERMLGLGDDQRRLAPLIEQAHENGRKAAAMEQAYWLVQYVNQTGHLHRFRADRAIEQADASALARQRSRIERDLRNVRWLADVADHVSGLTNDAIGAVERGELMTRDRSVAPAGPATGPGPGRRRVAAVIAADAELSGLAWPRDLCRPDGRGNLGRLLARLERCRGLDAAIILTPTPGAVGRLLGERGRSVEIVPVDPIAFRERQRHVAAGRLWSRHCWRGGLGNLSIYDEALHARETLALMHARGIDAALVLHADWALADPALIDACIERYRERPDASPIVFTQAAPGLAGCIVSRACMDELARGGPFGSIGGLLGYVPVLPQMDPIARPVCVPVDTAARDVCARCIPDSQPRRAWIEDALSAAGVDCESESAAKVAEALTRAVDREPGPEVIDLDAADAAGAISALREARGRASGEPLGVTLGPDLLRIEGWRGVVEAARAAFHAVHVRTRLDCPGDEAMALLGSGADIISVGLLAARAETYAAVTGVDAFETARRNLEMLVDARAFAGRASPWIVPRIARCDAVYEEIEPFYDYWLMRAGACVIDPPARVEPGDRIAPLPWPECAAAKRSRSRRSVCAAVALEARVA